MTGAGRDISFSCDAVLTQRKMTLLPPVNEKVGVGDTQNLSVSENVIPEEYHIVKNKGIRCLELYEDAFTVQSKDQEQKLRVLPSSRPSGRSEVIQSMRMMDDMSEKAGVDQQSDESTELCQQVELVQQHLTEGLRETHSSSDVVQGYHQLYESHRARSEDQSQQLTQDRDRWSQFTFKLALKVIKVKRLQLVSESHVSEKGWFKTAEHCLSYISTKDTQDSHNIVDLTSYWKEQSIVLMSQSKNTENAQFAQVTSVQQGIAKWSLFLNTRKKDLDPKYDRATVEEIHADLRQWSHMSVLQCEEYIGEKQLLLQQKSNELRSVSEKWLDMSLQLFERHAAPDSESAEGLHTIRESDRVLAELLRQFDIQVSGESGIHRSIMSSVGLMESWVSKTNAAIKKPDPHTVMSVSDWLKSEQALIDWQNLAEEIFLHFSITESQNQKDKNKPDLYTETKKALDGVQEFTSRSSNITESENQKLHEEVTCLHTGQTRWMLDSLLVMVPNQNEEENGDSDHDNSAKSSLQALLEDARMLSDKSVYFSKIINRTCNLILEEKMMVDPNETEMENETKECKKLQRDCNSWVESCKILLKIIQKSQEQVVEQPEQPSISTESAESMETQVTEEPLIEAGHIIENIRDGIEPEPTERMCEEPETQQQKGELMDCERPVSKSIDYDTNITEKYMDENNVQSTGTDESVVSPVTEEANRAFSDLTAVVLSQQELSDAEVRARSAEQRASKAEEASHAASEKIRDLERQLQSQPAPEPQREDEAKKTLTPSSPTVTAPASTKSPTGEAKLASTTKKTKKR